MLRPLSLIGWAAVVAAQFDFVHSQYETSSPVYPSPQISGAGGWDESLVKAREFLAELTAEEKAQIVTGTHRSSQYLKTSQAHFHRNRWTLRRQHRSNSAPQLHWTLFARRTSCHTTGDLCICILCRLVSSCIMGSTIGQKKGRLHGRGV